MIEVRIYEREPFQPEREFAVVSVDDGAVQITSDDAFAQRVSEIQILDPDTGAHVTAKSDPEKWAQLLPTAYRTPYMRAVITRHD